MNATWARDLSTFSGRLMGKTQYKSDKISHNMTQIASVLPVATISISLWTLISRQRRGLICGTKIPMQELEPKMQGKLIREGA